MAVRSEVATTLAGTTGGFDGSNGA